MFDTHIHTGHKTREQAEAYIEEFEKNMKLVKTSLAKGIKESLGMKAKPVEKVLEETKFQLKDTQS